MAKIDIVINVDDKNAAKVIAGVRDSVKGLDDAAKTGGSGLLGLGQKLGDLKLSTIAAAAAFGGIANYIRQGVESAMEQQTQWQMLAQLLGNVGVSYQKVAGDVQGLISRQMELTTFTDDDLRGAFGRLLQTTGSYTAATQGLGTVLDVATAKQKDASSVAEAIGKAIARNTSTLGRYGIVLSESTKEQIKHADAAERTKIVLDELSERYGGTAAAAAQTFGGRVQQISRDMDELQETFGEVVIALAGSANGFAVVQGGISKLSDLVKDGGEVLAWFGGVFTKWRDVATAAFMQVGAHGLKLLSTIQNVTGKLYTALSNLPGGGGADSLFGKWGAEMSEASGRNALDAISGLAEAQRLMNGAWEAGDIAAADYRKNLDTLGVTQGKVTNNTEDLGAATEKAARASKEFAERCRLAREEMEKQARAATFVADTIADLGGEAGKAQREFDKFVDQAATYWDEVQDQGETAVNAVIAKMEELLLKVEELQHPIKVELELAEVDQTRNLETLAKLKSGVLAWQQEVLPKMKTALADTLAEGLMAVFSGEGAEGILSAWEGLVGQMGQMASQQFSKAMQTGMSGGGMEGFKGEGGWQSIGMMIGVGFMNYAQKKGSILAGAVGGAATGASIGSMFPGYGTAIGAVIGAIVGAAMTYYANQQIETPESRWTVGGAGATLETRGGQGYSPEMQEDWTRRATSMYRSYLTGFYNVLRQWGTDAEGLFAMLAADLPEICSGGEWAEVSAQNMLQVLADVKLPDLFSTYFGEALAEGLQRSGLSPEAVQRLWDELGEMPGTERLNELGQFVQALVTIGKLTAANDWATMLDQADMTAMEQFSRFGSQVQEAINTAFLGMDQMTLLQRAEQATQIETAIGQAQDAALQMLSNIAQAQQQVHDSLMSQWESLEIGGMNAGEQRSYAFGQIQDLMEQLGKAGSPEEAQGFASRIQEYINLIATSLGDALYTTMAGGENPLVAALTGQLEGLGGSLGMGSMMQEVLQTPMGAFGDQMLGILQDTESLFAQMDSADLATQLQLAGQIADLEADARRAAVDMLRQIDQMSKQVNASLDAQVEGLRVGGMTAQEQGAYAYSKINELMGQLQLATGVEQAQGLVGDIQRYVSMMEQAGSGLEGGMPPGLREYLIQQLEQARGIFTQKEEEARASVESQVTRQVEAMTENSDALAIATGAIEDLAAFMGVGDTSGTWADWLQSLLTETDELAGQAFDAQRGEVQKLVDFLAEQLQRLSEALTTALGQDWSTGGGPGAGAGLGIGLVGGGQVGTSEGGWQLSNPLDQLGGSPHEHDHFTPIDAGEPVWGGDLGAGDLVGGGSLSHVLTGNDIVATMAAAVAAQQPVVNVVVNVDGNLQSLVSLVRAVVMQSSGTQQMGVAA